jgi:drug/metabolite transporter (DMT)-like permease
MMVLLHGMVLGAPFPAAGMVRWLNLGASGILAFVISSYFMLNAYQQIGPRLTMLVASFAPVLGAILAWLLLGQTLPPNAAIGIAIVTFGVVWVVGERGKAKGEISEGEMRQGVLYAALGTLAQATAFIFASQGLAGGFPSLSATLIRITAGIVALWLFLALQRRATATINTLQGDGRLLLLLIGAALSGPVLSGYLLLVSFQHIPIGVATTLSHTTSIMLIPIGYFVFKESITVRAIVGTVITVIGIALFFV